MSALAYRRDLDGLRALAVLLVVTFHFGATALGGGYVGVDLFFVISGFLIASIFEREARITPAFLVGFYRRRIQRLLPAFVAVAIVTTLVAGVLLLPEDFEAFLKSLRASFLFRANVWFAKATTGYFASNASELPWLHTWSLSIEWQFYLVFPFVVGALRVLPSRAARRWALFVATVAALIVSTTITADHPAMAYLSTAARAFEFLLGALAATVEGPTLGRRAALAISGLCVAGLVATALLFGPDTPFPGLHAAAVCLLGFALVVVGRTASILSFDAAAFVGKRSYSAYLWHWPIVAFLAYVQVRPSALDTALIVAGLCGLSDLTYRFVERPGVAARWTFVEAFGFGCVAPLIVTAGASVLVARHDGFPQRLGREAAHAYANLEAFDNRQGDRCHDNRADDLEACAFGDLQGRRTALLVGDSHARHFRPFVQILAGDAHVKVYGLTDSECLALEHVVLPAQFETREACGAAVDRDYRLIRDRHFDFVVIAERWIGYPADQLARLDASLDAIAASGAIPVLFKPVAEDGTSPKDCFYRHIKLRRTFTDRCSIAADNPFAATKKREVDVLLDAMKTRHPTLRVIDPQAVQCEHGQCTTVIDDTPIYSDTHHLDAFGATMLGRAYLALGGNPFGP